MPSRRSRRPRLLARAPYGALTFALALALPLLWSAGPAQAAADPALQRKLSSVLSDPRSSTSETAVIVLDANTGEQVYSRSGSRAGMPASNTKILTAASALETLGEDYRFKTEVIRRARMVDGVVQGRLYLKGYGDPTTRQADYGRLAAQAKAYGITRVTGKLVVDATFFDARQYNSGWSTGYADDYYAAPVSALTVAPNADYDSGTTIINYAPGSRGKKAKITTTPAAAARYIKIVNLTTTSARGTSTTFSAQRNHGSNTITLRGRVPQGRSTGHRLITVHRPDLYAGAVFRAELAKVGITVEGSTIASAMPAKFHHLVARDHSMRLSSLMVPYMKLSNNMHAEALTKTMGRVGGRPGTWRDGLAVTTGYLRSVGVPMTGVSLTDGSGLTRQNRVTPRAFATLLVKARTEPWYGSFQRSLPVAGVSERMVGGTLRWRMSGTAAAGNARAKTGTLTGVTALSGYVTGRDGRAYAFSLVSNYRGSTPRPVEDKVVVALAAWTG